MITKQVELTEALNILKHCIEYGLPFSCHPMFSDEGEITDTIIVSIDCDAQTFSNAMCRELTTI